MAISLPSPRIIVADVQEIKEFQAEFVYNFFQPDERTNDSGLTAPEFVRTRPAESFDAKFIESDKFNRFTSRYVKFDWKPLVETKSIAPGGLKIATNLQKVYYEQDFAGQSSTLLTIQDTNIDNKINFFVEKLVEQKRKLEFPDATTGSLESPQDIAKILQPDTSEEIEGALLMAALDNYVENGYLFHDRDGKGIRNESLLEEIKNDKQWMQINNKFYGTILHTAITNGLSVFRDEAESLLERAKDIENSAKSKKDSSILNSEEYDLEISDFVNYRTVNTDGYTPRKQILGYIIDKKETTINGNTIVHDPIIVDSSNAYTAIDFRIKYGSTYTYTIRSVAYVESQAIDVESKEIVVVSYLISSKPSHMINVACIERVSPPPPADFNVNWDYGQKTAFLSWNFPVNTQRDIKRWQVFRRVSINEPFELLKIFDFDDSTLPGPDNEDTAEFPNPDLIEYLSNPQNYYTDRDFKKDSKYIYTVCSVDAHGYSSNYGMQIECTFDRFKNKINKKIISPSGAPKAYPNILLNSDTFIDAIKDSGHKKLRIIFDPEYLKITDAENNNLNFLRTSDNSFYRMNLINVDLQEQRTIEIRLLDKRTTTKKDKQEKLVQNRIKRFGRIRKQTSRV